jgi:hypothetical protein
MMKKMYVVGAIAIAAILWKRGKDQEAAKNKISEAKITDGTNWTGDTWARLNGGTDLLAPVSRNMDGSIVADPGIVGQRSVNLMPSWNGSLA